MTLQLVPREEEHTFLPQGYPAWPCHLLWPVQCEQKGQWDSVQLWPSQAPCLHSSSANAGNRQRCCGWGGVGVPANRASWAHLKPKCTCEPRPAKSATFWNALWLQITQHSRIPRFSINASGTQTGEMICWSPTTSWKLGLLTANPTAFSPHHPSSSKGFPAGSTKIEEIWDANQVSN